MVLDFQEITDLSPLGMKLLNDQIRMLWFKAKNTRVKDLRAEVGEKIDLSSNVSITSKVSTDDMGSVIEQNATSVRIAVGQIGGTNILYKNSFPIRSITDDWYYTIPESDNVLYYLDPGSPAIMSSPSLKLKANTTYTLIFQAISTSGSDQTISVDLYPDDLPETSFTIGGIDPNHKYIWTFTTTSNANFQNCTLRFFGYLAARINICRTILFEGNNVNTVWTPNINELKNTLVEINTDHLRATFTDGSYSEMVPTGFHHASSNGTFDYNYLIAVGSGYKTATGVVTITLPDEFKGRNFDVAVSLKDVAGGTNMAIKDFMVYVCMIDRVNGVFQVDGWADLILFISPYTVTGITFQFSWVAVG